MKKIFAIIIILLLVGCSSKTTYKTISTEETFNEIKKTKIVDVRSEAEYNSGHIESSVNIPLDKLETINYKTYKPELLSFLNQCELQYNDYHHHLRLTQ